jgi:hypothetical protein
MMILEISLQKNTVECSKLKTKLKYGADNSVPLLNMAHNYSTGKIDVFMNTSRYREQSQFSSCTYKR